MQQSIYNSINSNGVIIQTTKTTAATTRRVSLARRIAQRWDMIGVVALMTSSAAYAVYAIVHAV